MSQTKIIVKRVTKLPNAAEINAAYRKGIAYCALGCKAGAHGSHCAAFGVAK